MPTKIDIINRELEIHLQRENDLIIELQGCKEIISALEERKHKLLEAKEQLNLLDEALKNG